MSEVVVIGPTSRNLIVELEVLPDPRSQMITASHHWRSLGGTSAGKSLHLAALGRSTTCVTATGDDADATTICDELEAAGVSVLPIRGLGPSEHHLNVMTRAGERLSIYLDHAPATTVSPRERAAVCSALAGARLVALDLSDVGRKLLDVVRHANLPVWVDLHDYDGANPFHADFIAAADVVLMNGDGMADPIAFLRGRVSAGAFAGVCTLGADGAIGVAADGEVVHVPAVPVEVVDTNGAGDAFAAGMVRRVLGHGHTGPLDGAALRAAMVAGALQAPAALASRGLAPTRGALGASAQQMDPPADGIETLQ